MHIAKGLQYTEQIKNICETSTNEYLKRLAIHLTPVIIFRKKFLMK